MTEESQEVPENTVKEPENPENVVENAPENAAEIEAANSKRRGRPAGSKDKAPRKKKIVVVEAEVSEPVVPPEEEPKPPPKASPKTPKPPSKRAQSSAEPEEQPSAQSSAQPSAQSSTQPSEQVEPLSPNTIVREASRHILKLKSISAQARRDHIFQTYTSKLHAI